MNGLRYESLADMPEGMRARVAGKVAVRKKLSKYHNEKTQVGAIRFDSRKEARRYETLLEYMRLGLICDLRLQVDFTIREAYTNTRGDRVAAIRYRADFTYMVADKVLDAETVRSLNGRLREFVDDAEYWRTLWNDKGERLVIEDVKGVRTDVYKMKKKLMADRGFYIREI